MPFETPFNRRQREQRQFRSYPQFEVGSPDDVASTDRYAIQQGLGPSNFYQDAVDTFLSDPDEELGAPRVQAQPRTEAPFAIQQFRNEMGLNDEPEGGGGLGGFARRALDVGTRNPFTPLGIGRGVVDFTGDVVRGGIDLAQGENPLPSPREALEAPIIDSVNTARNLNVPTQVLDLVRDRQQAQTLSDVPGTLLGGLGDVDRATGLPLRAINRQGSQALTDPVGALREQFEQEEQGGIGFGLEGSFAGEQLRRVPGIERDIPGTDISAFDITLGGADILLDAGGVAGAARALATDSPIRLSPAAQRLSQHSAIRSLFPSLSDDAIRPAIAGATSPVSIPGQAAQVLAKGDAARNAADLAARTGGDVGSETLRTLDAASVLVRQDKPGLIGDFLNQVPGLKQIRAFDQPRFNTGMTDDILESAVGRQMAMAEFHTRALPTRERLLQSVDNLFGDGAAEGLSTTVRFTGPQDGYPGIGTVYDIFQRPDLYELSDAQKALIKQIDQRNLDLRVLANDGYGTEIRQFVSTRPGSTYLPNVNASDAAKQLEELAGGASSTRSVAGIKSKPRVFDTGYDRWLNDGQRVVRGELDDAQRFIPETDIRRLLTGLDAQKASAVGESVWRSGVPGRTLTEVKESVAPQLVATRNSLRRQIDSLRGKIQRSEQAIRRDRGTTQALERQIADNDDRISRLIAQSEQTADGLPELDVLRGAIDELEIRQESLNRALVGSAPGAPTNTTVQSVAGNEPGVSAGSVAARQRMLADADTRIAEQRALDDFLFSVDATDGVVPARQPYLPSRDEDFARLVNAGEHITGESLLRPGIESVQEAIDTGRRLGYRDADIAAYLNRNFSDRAIGAARREVAGSPGPAVRFTRQAQRADALRDELADVLEEYNDVRRAYEAVNLQGERFVADGLYRYFPPEQAQELTDLSRVTNNRVFELMARANATVLSGDFSPAFGIQGQLAWLLRPADTTLKMFGAATDPTRPFRLGTLVDDIATDPDGWERFAFWMGRPVAGTQAVPDELAGGFLGKLPGFSEANEGMYRVALRRMKDDFDWFAGRAIADGATPDEAYAAAIDTVQKVFPTLSPTRLGQSAAQATSQRAPFTSIAFLRQPAALVQEGMKALTKTALRQPLTLREEFAREAILRITGTAITTISIASYMDAEIKGLDKSDHIATNLKQGRVPVPGTDFSFPLGAAFRGVYNAVRPQNVDVAGVGEVPLPFVGVPQFFENRIAPVISTQLDLIENEDYYGNPIVESDFPLNILEALAYERNAVAPIVSQGVIENAIEGEDPVTIAAEAAGDFLGGSLTRAPEFVIEQQTKDAIARGQEWTDPATGETFEVDSFDELSSRVGSVVADQLVAEQGSGRLADVQAAQSEESLEEATGVDDSNQAFAQLDAIGQERYAWAQGIQAEIDRGEITLEEARRLEKERNWNGEVAGVIRAFAPVFEGTEPRPLAQLEGITDVNDARDQYFAHLEQFIDPRTGKPSDEFYDDFEPRFIAAIGEDMWDRVQDNIGTRNRAPWQLQLRSLRGQLADTGYWELRDQAWEQLEPVADASQFDSFFDWKQAKIDEVLAQFPVGRNTENVRLNNATKVVERMPIVKLYRDILDGLETPWATAHPQIADDAVTAGYFDATDLQLGLISNKLNQ